jgi:hypothetical protein
MRKGIRCLIFALSACLLLLFASRVWGDQDVSWDSEDGFLPPTVVIAPGDAVTWWNMDWYGLDTWVYFDVGYSFYLPWYSTYTVIFPDEGTYGYMSHTGDRGTVVVNAAPSVTITNPVNGAVFTAPATFPIQARATDTDGIYSVQFYVDYAFIEEDYTSPYSCVATNVVQYRTNLSAGTWTFLATNVATAASRTVTNAAAAGPRFYRVFQQP